MEQSGNEASTLEDVLAEKLIGEHFFYAKVLEMAISSWSTAALAVAISKQNPERSIDSILEELPCDGLHTCVCDKPEEQKAAMEKLDQVFNTLAKKFMDTGLEKAKAAWPIWKLDPAHSTPDFGMLKCGKCFGCVNQNDKDCLEDAIARQNLLHFQMIK